MKIDFANLLSAALVGIVALTASVAWAGVAGQVTHLSGVLSAKRADGTSKLLAVRSEVYEGDLLTTEVDTYARIKFVDQAEVVLRPNSQLRVASYNYVENRPEGDNALLGLVKGGLRAVTGLIGKRNRDAVSVSTPAATIGIRGTHFGLLLCNDDCIGLTGLFGQPVANGLHVDVADGAIVLRNRGGEQLIAAGQFGFVGDGASLPRMVPPQQGVQVTMPPGISRNAPTGPGIGSARDQECVAQ